MDSIPTNRRTPAAWFFSRLRRQHRAYLCQEPGAEPISAPGGKSRAYLRSWWQQQSLSPLLVAGAESIPLIPAPFPALSPPLMSGADPLVASLEGRYIMPSSWCMYIGRCRYLPQQCRIP